MALASISLQTHSPISDAKKTLGENKSRGGGVAVIALKNCSLDALRPFSHSICPRNEFKFYMSTVNYMHLHSLGVSLTLLHSETM